MLWTFFFVRRTNFKEVDYILVLFESQVQVGLNIGAIGTTIISPPRNGVEPSPRTKFNLNPFSIFSDVKHTDTVQAGHTINIF
jgi:hypothetical protein